MARASRPTGGWRRRRDDRAVLYILHSGNLYGTERMALTTLAGLDEYPRRAVFAPSPHGAPSVTEAAREAGIEAVTFDSPWQLVKGLLPWLLRHRSLDVIGTGVSQSLICHVLARLLRVRVRQLQVAHGGTNETQAYGRKHVLNGLPVRFVAVSEFVRHKLIEHGVKPQAISVIDNFLPESGLDAPLERAPFDPGRPDARPMSRESVKVGVVSRIESIKRIDLLVSAVERHKLEQFQFDVYGTGTDLDALRERAAPLRNIRFHGFVPEVSDALAGGDFLLHLCPVEPFGLAILEGFRSRLVAIVPDTGGAANLVDDGVTGLRFRANDIDDLARVLLRAREMSPKSLQRLADAGHAALESRFSPREGVRRYREALRAA